MLAASATNTYVIERAFKPGSANRSLSDLRRSVEAERTRDVVLDLSEVSLVDMEVVRFLLHCEMQGIRLAHCPAYVREWMVREKRPP
jgi:hypothetical protein